MALKLKIDLATLPRTAKILIAGGLPLAIVVSFYFAYYKPGSDEIKRLKGIIAKQEKEISNAETKLRKLPEIKARYQVLLKELEELKRQLPEEKEVTNLLKQVSDLGIKAGLQIKLWKPAGRKLHSSGIVYEVPVKVEMIGSYHRLGHFFSTLTGLDRIVNVSDIKMGKARPAMNEAVLEISFTALTFSAVPDTQSKSAAAGQKKGAGRGGRRR